MADIKTGTGPEHLAAFSYILVEKAAIFNESCQLSNTAWHLLCFMERAWGNKGKQ